MATVPELFKGKEPVTFEHDGAPVFIGPATVVRAGHPIMRGREHLFEPLIVHFDVASEPAAPAAAPDPVAAVRRGPGKAGGKG